MEILKRILLEVTFVLGYLQQALDRLDDQPTQLDLPGLPKESEETLSVLRDRHTQIGKIIEKLEEGR